MQLVAWRCFPERCTFPARRILRAAQHFRTAQLFFAVHIMRVPSFLVVRRDPFARRSFLRSGMFSAQDDFPSQSTLPPATILLRVATFRRVPECMRARRWLFGALALDPSPKQVATGRAGPRPPPPQHFDQSGAGRPRNGSKSLLNHWYLKLFGE